MIHSKQFVRFACPIKLAPLPAPSRRVWISGKFDTENHFDNLADILPDDILEPIGNDMVQNFMDYKASRKDWEQSYTSGLDLLGFKYENRTEPFQGASGATHPVLAEAVTQFQAQAYKELLPADGPVRTQIIGKVNHALNRVNIKINVIIRPRGGDFLFSNDEFEAMKHDIVTLKAAGINGVVIGMLNTDGSIGLLRWKDAFDVQLELN